MPYATRANAVAKQLDNSVVWRLRSKLIEPKEVFFPEDIEILREFARSRIIRAFRKASEHARGKERSTDNYIANIGRRPSELAKHIADRVNRDFIDISDFGGHFAQWPLKMKLLLVDSLQYNLILDELNALMASPQHGIYYMESHNHWQLVQSVVDELPRPKHRDPYVDRRTYHGRVRSQSQGRGIPAGVSTSWSPAC